MIYKRVPLNARGQLILSLLSLQYLNETIIGDAKKAIFDCLFSSHKTFYKNISRFFLIVPYQRKGLLFQLFGDSLDSLFTLLMVFRTNVLKEILKLINNKNL